MTDTIHEIMSNTIFKVAMKISDKNYDFKLWYKAQVVVGTIRNQILKKTIFVVYKQYTIHELVKMIKKEPTS